AISSS
ncbi:hypothetical protein CP8484711_0143B, partial [Chlamydia psittaci 84-8471/1]